MLSTQGLIKTNEDKGSSIKPNGSVLLFSFTSPLSLLFRIWLTSLQLGLFFPHHATYPSKSEVYLNFIVFVSLSLRPASSAYTKPSWTTTKWPWRQWRNAASPTPSFRRSQRCVNSFSTFSLYLLAL